MEGQFLGGWGGRGGWGHTCRVVTSSPTPSPDCCPLPVQSWGGKENGFGLAECCRDLHMMVSPGWQTGGLRVPPHVPILGSLSATPCPCPHPGVPKCHPMSPSPSWGPQVPPHVSNGVPKCHPMSPMGSPSVTLCLHSHPGVPKWHPVSLSASWGPQVPPYVPSGVPECHPMSPSPSWGPQMPPAVPVPILGSPSATPYPQWGR